MFSLFQSSCALLALLGWFRTSCFVSCAMLSLNNSASGTCLYEKLLLFVLNTPCVTKNMAEIYIRQNLLPQKYSLDYFLSAGILKEYRCLDENQNIIDCVALGSEGYALLDMAYLSPEEYRELQILAHALAAIIKFRSS